MPNSILQDTLEEWILKHRTDWCTCIDLSFKSDTDHAKFALKNLNEYYSQSIDFFRNHSYKPRPHMLISTGKALETYGLSCERGHIEMVRLVHKMYQTCIDGAFIVLPFNQIGRTADRLFVTQMTLEAMLSAMIPLHYRLKFFAKTGQQISMANALVLSSEVTLLLEISKLQSS